MFKWLNAFKWLVAGCVAAALSGCGYNTLQTTDEDIKATWAEVLNQYQRRADLVPNLVNVVKGYAAHEQEVFTSVTEARARVGAIQATPELINDEAAFQKFIAAQGELTGAISRLLLVAGARVANTGMRWQDETRQSLGAAWGGPPTRIEPVAAHRLRKSSSHGRRRPLPSRQQVRLPTGDSPIVRQDARATSQAGCLCRLGLSLACYSSVLPV